MNFYIPEILKTGNYKSDEHSEQTQHNKILKFHSQWHFHKIVENIDESGDSRNHANSKFEEAMF